MKKILLLTTEFPPQPGGIGNQALHLAKGLSKCGYQVEVICDSRSTTGAEEMAFDNALPFKVERIGRKRFILISYFKRIQQAFKYVKKNEVVICSGKFSLWLGAFLSFFFHRQFLAILHGSELLLPNPILKTMTRLSLKRFQVLVAVSNFTKSLVSHLGRNKIYVVPNGFEMKVDEDFQDDNPVTMPNLVTIGNVTKRKGQQNVIKALPTIRKKYADVKYHIVGIPTQQAKLQKLALSLGVETAVIFYGVVTEAHKIETLKRADVFIMLSEATKKGDVEGFGIAILEANSMGVPAIGATKCGIEDAIKENTSGKLVDAKNPDQILDALDTILSNYSFFSDGAREWSKNFSWEKVIEKYVSIIETENAKR